MTTPVEKMAVLFGEIANPLGKIANLAGGIVTNRDLPVETVGHLWQHQLPRVESAAVAAAAIAQDQPFGGFGIARLTETLPPAFEGGGGELGGVVVDADADPALVRPQVRDTVGDRLAQLRIEEIVNADFFGTPFVAPILEGANEFLLLRKSRDRAPHAQTNGLTNRKIEYWAKK